jgi:hypothetical protein
MAPIHAGGMPSLRLVAAPPGDDGLAPLPPGFATTRDALHQVAVHVLARRRHALCGKFGLRAAPAGFATPAAGPDHEVLRTSRGWLLRERTGTTASRAALDLMTASLSDAAAFAEVALDEPFEAGHDTPPVGDRTSALAIDHTAAGALGAWYAFAWSVIDRVTSALPAAASPSVLQLWPEHFDAGCDVGVGEGRTNVGASPGDGFHAEPYLYIGPWDDRRPGDEAYWNAPFGAVLPHAHLVGADAVTVAEEFLRRGLALLSPAR